MRRYQQRKVIELIKTLNEATNQLHILFSSKDFSSIINLLKECQNFAIQIGNFIETIKGEGTQSVSFLEEYCDLLYQASLEVSSGKGEVITRLQNNLVEIENCVKVELKPNKFEIAFFPYKASMFDCMESIWSAAKDDPQCDAYVVPVPYYDRLPGGELGEMHYEGTQYPDYVPIVDWKIYNVSECHPDVIITHNPYDNSNIVTSIHPAFFNERLKNFTDLLIYVPYFVSTGDIPDHFCVCAGTLYADKVIVQSEKVRQTYIRVFKEFEKANKCTGKFGIAEEKFMALGSPKIDKVVCKTRADYSIQQQWEQLLEKPDGSFKTVVLYNTSISDLLEGNDKVLQKLRYVFDYFRSKEDIVLWWRPHPLAEATYRSMRPHLFDQYKDIVNKFIQDGFGIYDDTADLHRAIAVSDAYYGDRSSLVELYRCAGKPVMIQDMDTANSDEIELDLSFENLLDDGEFFWFTAYDFNGLFRMDKRTWKAEYMGSFPEEKIDGKRLYTSIIMYDQRLYFSPFSASEIAVYDKRRSTFIKIDVKEPEGSMSFNYFEGCKFSEVIEYKGDIYFIPCSYPTIIKINPKTNDIKYYSGWRDTLNNMVNENVDSYFWKAIVHNNHIVMPSSSTNAVVDFDMESGASVVYEVGQKGYSYFSACFDGHNYWLAPKFNNPIIKWNIENNMYTEYNSYLEEFSGTKYNFIRVISINNEVLLLPYQANQGIKVGLDNENISCIGPELSRVSNEQSYSESWFLFAEQVGDKIYAYSQKDKNFFEIDSQARIKRAEKITISEEDVIKITEMTKQVFNASFESPEGEVTGYTFEGKILTLGDYLNYILDKSNITLTSVSREQKGGNLNVTSGTQIYKYAKEIMIG